MGRVNPPRPLLETDPREAFDCGRDSMNLWFRRHAWRNHAAGLSRVIVLTDMDTGAITAFISLSSASIERAALAKKDRRNRPDPIPATLLGQLAVDQGRQGEGHAAALVRHALKLALQLSKQIGSFGVITHPLDSDVRAFYRKLGFVDLPSDPGGAMIVRMVDLEASGFGGPV